MDMQQHLAVCRKVKNQFEAHGINVAEWARQNGFSPQCVYDVLNGRAVGRRGEAHRVAVALKIKAVAA